MGEGVGVSDELLFDGARIARKALEGAQQLPDAQGCPGVLYQQCLDSGSQLDIANREVADRQQVGQHRDRRSVAVLGGERQRLGP